MKHFYILDKDDLPVVDNLATQCFTCYLTCSSNGILVPNCPKYGNSRRQGKIKNSKSTTFLCCDKTKTTKLFKEKLDALSLVFPDVVVSKLELEEQIRKEEQIKVNRLVHNLTSINAFNIQEIYDLLPQSVLTSHWQDQLKFIQKEIAKNPKHAAMTFLRIAKNNIHMKSEFSIYRKLDREGNSELEFKNLSVRNILLNVLHTFFADFTDKNIYVDVEEFYEKVNVDYETIQVALYHLIENSLKYSKPNSKITITFISDSTHIEMKLKMTSTYIEPHERELIFNEGYSGEIARKMEKNGDGIGTWRIKQMMGLNEGSSDIIFGEDIEKVMGFNFCTNIFILKFKKGTNK